MAKRRIPENRPRSEGEVFDDEKDGDMYPTSASRTPLLSTSARIRSIIEDGEDSSGSTLHLSNRTLFTQLDVLVHFDGGQAGWKEMARWLKYQETVDTANRWSKPHVPTGSMHSLNEMRRLMSDGHCALGLALDNPNPGPHYIAEAFVDVVQQNAHYQLTDRQKQLLVETILKPHKHMHRKSAKHRNPSNQSTATGVLSTTSVSSDNDDNNNESEKPKKKFLRRRSGDGRDISRSYYEYPAGTTPDNLKPYKPNKHLGKKLPKNCEAANILVGQVDFLDETVIGLCRFDKPTQMGDLTEVDVPTRFFFLVLGPKSKTNIWELAELGRAMGSLLNDKVFAEVAYKAKTREDLVDAIDEFIDDLTVLPPSIWDAEMRLEPPAQTRSMNQILQRLNEDTRVKGIPSSPHQEAGAPDDESLLRTGRIFGGLIHDIKHRYKHYLSDLKDGLNIQCLASIIFLFFACITPIVTFGGLMGQKTDGYMGTMEMLLAGAICGFLYALFAGQPLTIVGATGPLMIFESIVYKLCKDQHIEFLSMRLWVGIWVAVIIIIIVVFDLSFLVRYITRFTEESFSILISVIFIYEAFMKIYDIYGDNLVHTGLTRQEGVLNCFCTPADWKIITLNSTTNLTDVPNLPADYNVTDDGNLTQIIFPSNWTAYYTEDCISVEQRLVVRYGCITKKLCLAEGGYVNGTACDMPNIINAVPDVFFLSVILFIGTFALAMAFRNFRTAPYFPARVRTTVADFAVSMSVVIWTGIDYFFGVPTPKLNVPEEFVTTRPDRDWLISPIAITYGWVIPVAIIPAILATILIFLDQQITAVIVNRKEHKLKKGHGYHLDILVLAVLILICSFLGLPWFVAATVRSLTHVKSLFVTSEVSIPGERPQMIGVREQRVTGMCIHILIGLATLITKILQLIPMPVLYGVFLYMGVTSLGDVQFIDRVAVMFMPSKYQPDHIYLRHVRLFRVYLFTIIQLLCFAGMWVVKSIKITAIAFPVMLVVLMAVRKLLDYVFTLSELYWLDHLLPDDARRQEEDKKAGAEKTNGESKYSKEAEALGHVDA